jgi:pimeloyl-ACP methyl ester carboxylesterase
VASGALLTEARTVTTDDGRVLGVREGGDPAGFPILVLHGSPGSSVLYAPHVADAAQRGIRLVSYDRPGYGSSSRDQGRNVADCVRDVTCVCDALEIERCAIWGLSSGGAHALAAAARLSDRVAAVAALACVAPYDAEGLDFTAGMGDKNVEEFAALLTDERSHLEDLRSEREQLLQATPDTLREVWRTLLGPADRDVVSGGLAEFMLRHMQTGLEHGHDGWLDDDIAFVWPWGFELPAIRVPVLHWHGVQDRFVPVGHADWLAANISGVESRITPEDGHLTLFERRIPEVHAWLLERATLSADGNP